MTTAEITLRAEIEQQLLNLLRDLAAPLGVDEIVQQLSKQHPRSLVQSVLLAVMDTNLVHVTPRFELELPANVRKSA